VHQIVEGAVIFSDPFAVAILGDDSRAGLSEMADDPSHRPMRLFHTRREPVSEDTLAACVARGVRQVVVLGAASTPFRCATLTPARVSDVRSRLPGNAGLEAGAPEAGGSGDTRLADLRADRFRAAKPGRWIEGAGFEAERPAFFQWLGVVMYLTREAVSETLDFIAGLPESESCSTMPSRLKLFCRSPRQCDSRCESAAWRGEPWLSLFEPNEVSDMVRYSGFGLVEDIALPNSRIDFTER